MTDDAQRARIMGFETATEDSWLVGNGSKRNGRKILGVGLVVGVILVMLGGLIYSNGTQELKNEMQSLNGKEDISYGVVVADTTTYPFVVRITIQVGVNSYRCTGSILSRTIVLTAAHCLDGSVAAGVTVTAGQVTVGGNAGTTQTRTASSFTQHAQSAGLARDIAVIEVDPPFDLTTSVDIIGEGSNRPPVGTQVTSVGWGMNENNAVQNSLKSATSDVYAGAACQADAFEICTRGGTGSTCSSDSGGPMLWQRNGIWELAGFNERSPNSHCSNLAGNVDIYESVPSYLVWIRGFLPTVSNQLTSTSCTQSCTNAGSAGINVGNNAMCAANYNNEGFRGGYNKNVNGQDVCVVGHGGFERTVSANFHCICATKLVALEPSNSQSCDTVCGARNTAAVETGIYNGNSAEKFYACGVDDGSGNLVGGFNLKKNGFSDKCYYGNGGQERTRTTFKCICV